MSIFSKVPIPKVRRNRFNLSYSYKTTMDMGIAYPVNCQRMVPGDKFKIGHEAIVQLNPLNAPPMTEMNMYFMDFFVPDRVAYKDLGENFFSDFISNHFDDDGDTPVLPRVKSTVDNTVGSLWDYFGFQTGVMPEGTSRPIDILYRVYNLIWNEYFRDEHTMEEVDLTHDGLLHVCWGRDYLTSALQYAQDGDPMAIPFSGTSSAVFEDAYLGVDNETYIPLSIPQREGAASNPYETVKNVRIGSPNNSSMEKTNLIVQAYDGNYIANIGSENYISNAGVPQKNTVDLSNGVTADVNDLRLMWQVQRWQERNNRCGSRYTEFLRAQYGVSPRDERLQRPEFIGGCKMPVITSQVLQTAGDTADSSGNTTPIGTKYGQGMVVDSGYSGSYFAQEFGVLMTICFIRPKSSYQSGIERQWTPQTYLDYFNPLFVGLGEQEIRNEEVYVQTSESDNLKVWGYQGRYNELRHNNSKVTGKMRDTFSYWHLARQFDSLPNLNAEFLTCNPSKRIFQAPSEVGFICNIGHRIDALRPMPYLAMPN